LHYRSSLNERSPVALPKASPEPLSTGELAAWRGFLRTHARLLRHLDRQLTDEQGLPTSSYEVLLRLVEAPGGTMRMKDIADSLLLSRSGLSRVVDELERKGYVARQACSSDARGTEAVITRSGRSAFRKAQRSHLSSVRAEFLDKLSEEQQRQLAEAWTAVGLAVAPDTDYGS
jgi:DNA-binding MarR family transcriptional regulator